VTSALRALGARIKILRKEAELTQETLADGARLDTKHLQAIESGKVNVTVASLVGIARALGVQVGTLFDAETKA
jgi:transcriptional regulator with XRE-family HTH domain